MKDKKSGMTNVQVKVKARSDIEANESKARAVITAVDTAMWVHMTTTEVVPKNRTGS